MSLVKRLLDWNEEKFEKIDVFEDKHAILKSAGYGFLNGLVDGVVITYPILLIGYYYWIHKALSK